MREYHTGEVAAIIGVHPNTVRLYEQWGMISKPERRQNGYRVFTQLHIRQMRLARKAFEIEVLQNGLRKNMVETVKACARHDYDGALALARQYLCALEQERANAEEAIVIAREALYGGAADGPGADGGPLLRRREASDLLGVSMDALRNWEMNGLLCVKRRQNGYRVYTQSDVARLKMIRSLRCANYSLEAILRLLNRLSSDPDADMKEALNTPGQSEDVISVCDKLLLSLSAAEENARAILAMLMEMKEQKN